MISVTVDYSILFYVCAGCHNPWPTDTVEVMMRRDVLVVGRRPDLLVPTSLLLMLI